MGDQPPPSQDGPVSIREVYGLLERTQDRLVSTIREHVATMEQRVLDADRRLADRLDEHLKEHAQQRDGTVSRARFTVTTTLAAVALLASIAVGVAGLIFR